MPIRKIYFQIHEDSINQSHESDFCFHTYFVTEYLSRIIAKKKLKYKTANQLLIYIDSPVDEITYEEMFKSISIHNQVNYTEIGDLGENKNVETLLKIIQSSADGVENLVNGISKSVKGAIYDFKNSSFKNIWNFHQRTLKELGKINLECELNVNNFILSLVITNKDQEIYRKELLKELPDSLCYHHKFNKMSIDSEKITIPDRMDGILYQTTITKLRETINAKHT